MQFKKGDKIIHPQGDIWECVDAERSFFRYIGGGTPRDHWRGVNILFGEIELRGFKKYTVEIKSNKPAWF